MRILTITAGLLAALFVAATLLLRTPAVENALFEQALANAFSPRQAALFDGDGLKVVFCGTSSPIPSKKRAQACTGIVAGDRFFMVDAGTGSWETFAVAGVPADKLAGVFLTHFHSDHIGDLGEANLGSWIAGRPEPLSVYGPKGVETVVAGFDEAFALDNIYRTAHHGPEIANPETAGMVAAPFDGAAPTVVYDRDGLKVTAFPVDHGPVKPAVGYRFDYQGRSVVISGDTSYTQSLIENAKGADLLVHEAQSNRMVAKMRAAAEKAGNTRIAKVLGDIPSYHTTPEEAARAANEAGVPWLVLTHLTPPPDNPVAKRIFMRGVSKIRKDHVRLAEDGLVVSLPKAGGVRFSRLK